MTRRSLKQLLTFLQPLAAVAALLLTTGCERRPMEVILDETVRVKLVINWQVNFAELYGEEPNGMTIMLWGSNAQQPTVRAVNGNSIMLNLKPDTYRMLIFSDREDEYAPYMQLRDAGSYDDISMRCQHFRLYDEDFIYNAEQIGIAADTFSITEEMVLRDTTVFVPYEKYRDNPDAIYHESERLYEIPEVGMPMTVNLYLKAKVKRYHSIKSIEADLSGLADGFFMTRVNRTTEAGTMILNPETWHVYRYGDTADSLGIITNETLCFGLPYGKETLSERDSTDNVLRLRVTLTDNSVQTISYNVGKELRYLTPEGREAQIRYREDLHNILLELDLSDVIVMPPMPDTGAGTGFSAVVDEWEDGGTIDIGM